MSATDILGWAAQVIKAVADAIGEAVRGAEPPTYSELQAKVHAAIDARSAAWLKDAEAEANRALARAAADEFDPKP